MSNDPVRITFSDGTQLFTMGDGVSVVTDRLWDTEEEASAAYSAMKEALRARGADDPLVKNYYRFHFSDDKDVLERAKVDAEVVEIEIQDGGGEWEDMYKPFCKASKTQKRIVDGPSYSEGDYA